MIVDYIVSDIQDTEIWKIEEVKNYLRISHDYDDELISNLIQSAIDYAELFTGLNFRVKDIVCKVNNLNHSLSLKYIPILEIEEVLYVTHHDNIDITNEFGHVSSDNTTIHFKDKFLKGNVNIKYQAGYKDNIPHSIKQGILMHVSSMYDHTESSENLNLQIKDLYTRYRSMKV